MAASIGEQLRKAREERGAELSEGESATKIRLKFLQAMEEDRWEELPGPPYNRSFLASYAEFLGLDAQAVVEEYKRTAEPPGHAEAVPPTAIHTGSLRPPRSARPTALIIAGLVAVILLGVVIGVSLGGSGNGGGDHKTRKQASANGQGRNSSTTTPTASTGTTSTATQVSVALRATDLVWVCLVDARGRPEVNSETLTAGETRGPYDGPGFEATFGNGSIELTVNGEAAKVPQLAEPVSFRITPDGTRRLSPGGGPTCA
jgi:cytoskeletal protein RodZ